MHCRVTACNLGDDAVVGHQSGVGGVIVHVTEIHALCRHLVLSVATAVDIVADNAVRHSVLDIHTIEISGAVPPRKHHIVRDAPHMDMGEGDTRATLVNELIAVHDNVPADIFAVADDVDTPVATLQQIVGKRQVVGASIGIGYVNQVTSRLGVGVHTHSVVLNPYVFASSHIYYRISSIRNDAECQVLHGYVPVPLPYEQNVVVAVHDGHLVPVLGLGGECKVVVHHGGRNGGEVYAATINPIFKGEGDVTAHTALVYAVE